MHVTALPDGTRPSRFLSFSREEWAQRSAHVPVPLCEEELARLQGIDERLSLREVEDVYLPLAHLLKLHMGAARGLHRVTQLFLGSRYAKTPYLLGIAGSVAVGKSTTARLLQALLSRSGDHRRVDLVTTDGFLFPNRVLEERGLMGRKGFPESYDLRRLVRFVSELKAGRTNLQAPVYSHLSYDILPGEMQTVHRPDIVILEGLTLLQTGTGTTPFVSDFLDFSIYVDAALSDLRRWYVSRFLRLRDTVFHDPGSYFQRYARLSEAEATETALRIWETINEVNLKQNIEPTRERASLILEKGEDHVVRRVRMRKL